MFPSELRYIRFPEKRTRARFSHRLLFYFWRFFSKWRQIEVPNLRCLHSRHPWDQNNDPSTCQGIVWHKLRLGSLLPLSPSSPPAKNVRIQDEADQRFAFTLIDICYRDQLRANLTKVLLGFLRLVKSSSSVSLVFEFGSHPIHRMEKVYLFYLQNFQPRTLSFFFFYFSIQQLSKLNHFFPSHRTIVSAESAESHQLYSMYYNVIRCISNISMVSIKLKNIQSQVCRSFNTGLFY